MSAENLLGMGNTRVPLFILFLIFQQVFRNRTVAIIDRRFPEQSNGVIRNKRCFRGFWSARMFYRMEKGRRKD